MATTKKKVSKKVIVAQPNPLNDFEIAKREINEFIGSNVSCEDHILRLLKKTFNSIYLDPEFFEQLGKIKMHFALREYNAIFSNPNYLNIYSAEYIPGRALCYYNLFLKNDLLRNLIREKGGNILCLGSGAGSELIGISSSLLSSKVHVEDISSSKLETDSSQLENFPYLTVHIQDLADYSAILEKLTSEIRGNLNISDSVLRIESSVGNVLDQNNVDNLAALLGKAGLVTCMFLLNELFASSKASVVKLITQFVTNIKPGSLLLVVDSAGSFSNLNIGEREYKIYILLDKLKDFEIVESSDSTWYRFKESPETASYPTKLNNMRYFIRLYRRI